MNQQAQIDALEHLVMAMLKRNGLTLSTTYVFQDAEASIMGSDGPPGAMQKTEAVDYLAHLKSQFGG